MSPTERQQRITRRRRLAHLGVGGVIIAAASVRIAAAEDPAPAPTVPTVAAPASTYVDIPPRPKPRVNRSHVRHRLHRPKAQLAPTPRPRPARPRPVATVATSVGWSSWDRVAACESGGDWHTNTGNGYYGGLQEDMGFWTTYDGLTFASRPDLATRSEQIIVASRARDGYTNRRGEHNAARGYSPWPVCGRRA